MQRRVFGKADFTLLANPRKLVALLTGVLFLVSTNLAYAGQPGGGALDRGAWRSFKQANPGVDKQELRNLFQQQFGLPGNNPAIPQPHIQPVKTHPSLPNLNPSGAPLAIPGPVSVPAGSVAQPGGRSGKSASFNTNLAGGKAFKQGTQQLATGRFVYLKNGVNLDLESVTNNITLGNKLFKTTESVTINVGGQQKTIGAGSQVTAGEYIAAKQVLAGVGQKLALDGQGRAVGGSVDLDAITQQNDRMRASNLVVPTNVTALGDFGKGSEFHLTGDLTNSGTVYALSSSNKVKAGAIRADDITNNEGALISSVLPESLATELGSQQSSVDLTLKVNGDLTNYGTIESSGDLTLSAGNSIKNIQGEGGSTPLLTAQKNLNLLSPNVTNNGRMESLAANVNLGTPVPQELNVDNNGGTIAALNGAINVRPTEYAAAFDSNVRGGDLLSKELNLNTGAGTINVDVDQLTGKVNASGTAAHVWANTDNLVLGKQCLVGDPTYYNGGNITLDGDLIVGDTLAVLSTGNIVATANLTRIEAVGNGVDAPLGQGQNIYIISGASLTPSAGATTASLIPPDGPIPGGETVTVNGAGGGGDIDFSLADSNLQITAAATVSGQSGGSVNLFAFDGRVLLPQQSTIDTSGMNAANGDINVASGGAATLGNLIAYGGAGSTGGNITAVTTNATVNGGGVVFDSTGAISSGSLTVGGPSVGGSLQIGGGGNNQMIASGGDIRIQTNSNTLTIDLGPSGVLSTQGGSVLLTSFGEVRLTIPGGISTSPVSGSGGDVSILADQDGNGSGPVLASDVSINTSAAGTGNAGSISTYSGSNGFGVGFTRIGALTANGAGGGSAGDISVDSGDQIFLGGAVSALGTGGGAIDIQVRGNNGSISLGGDIAGLSLNIAANGAGQITFGADLTLTANTLDLGSVLDIGSNDLVIKPQTAVSISLGAPVVGTGTLDINATELSRITAASLTIGDRNLSGGMTLNGAINVSGPGAPSYDLTLNNRGNFDAANNNITLGSKFLLMDMGGSTTLASVTGTSDVTVTSAGSINVGSILLTGVGSDIILKSTGGGINAGQLQADPIIMLASSNIILTGNVTADNGILIVSGQSVGGIGFPGAININASSNSGPGGDVVIIAGAAFTDNGTDIDIQGPSATGGSIDFTGFSGVASITSNSTAPGFDGGDVTLVAYAANNTGGNGDIVLPGNSNIVTTGAVSGNSGDVTIIAGAVSGLGIQTGSITTTSSSSGQSGSGDVTICATTPGGSLATPINIDTSTSVGSYAAGAFLGGAAQASDITTGSITARGAEVTVSGNADASLGGVNVSATNGQGGNASISVGGSLTLGIVNASGNNGSGGSIDITAAGALNIASGTMSANGVGTDMSGGAISINADTLTIAPGFLALEANGTGAGGGGSISVSTVSSALSLGTAAGEFTVSAAGPNSSIDISGGGGIAINGSGGFAADDINLTSGAGANITIDSNTTANDVFNIVSGGDISAGAQVTGTNTLNISAQGDILTTGSGRYNGGTVILNSITGSIGAGAASRANVNAVDLQANAANGDVFLSELNTVNLAVGQSSALNAFDLLASGNITSDAAGDVSAADVVLRSVNGSLMMAGEVTGTNSVTLRSRNSLTNASANVNAPELILVSDFGSIGTSALLPFTTNASLITAQALFGSVFIADGNTGNLDIVDAGGFVNSANSGGTWSLTGTNGAGTSIRSLPGVSIFGGTVRIESTAGGLALGGDITGPGSVSLSSAADLTNTSAFGTITTTQLNLSSTAGNIGVDASTRLVIDVSNNVTLNAAGDVFVYDPNNVTISGGLSSANGTFDVLAGGNVTNYSPISAADLVLGSSGGDLFAGANISGTNSLSLYTLGSGSITKSVIASIVAPDISLTSDTGNIGLIFTPFAVDSPVLSVNTSGTANVLNSETGGITLNVSTGSTLKVYFNSDIMIGGQLLGDDIQLIGMNGSDAGIDIQSDITATNSVALQADGAGNITQTASPVISGPSVSLISGTGDIGTASQCINVDTDNLSYSTLGAAYICSNSTGVLNVGPWSGSTLNLTNGGAINVIGVLDASDCVILTTLNNSDINIYASILADDCIELTAGGIGNINAFAPAALTIRTGIGYIDLQSGGGNIGSSSSAIQMSTPNLIAFTGGAGNVTISNSFAGDVNIIDVSGAGGVFTYTGIGAAGATLATIANGVVQANSASIAVTNGSIGAVSSPFRTDLSTLTVNAPQNVIVNNARDITLAGPSSANQTFCLSADGDITTSLNITAVDVAFINNAGSGGSLSLMGTLAGSNSIALVSSADLMNGDFAVLDTPNLILGSSDGSVGSSISRLSLDGSNAPSLANLSAFSAAQDVHVKGTFAGLNLDDVNNPCVSGVNSAAATYYVENTGSISSSGAIAANDVSLYSYFGSFSLAGTVTGTQSVTLFSDGAITNSSWNIIDTPWLNLSGSDIGSADAHLVLNDGGNVLNLTNIAPFGQNVFIDYNGADIIIGPSTISPIGGGATSHFEFSSSGNITIAEEIATGDEDIVLNAGGSITINAIVNANHNVFITAAGSISNFSEVRSFNDSFFDVHMESTGGDIILGSVSANNLTAIASGDLTLSAGTSLNNSVTLDAGGTITQTSGILGAAGLLDIAFGTGGVAIATNVGSLTTNAAGQGLIINEANGIDLLAQNLGSLDVNANGTITTSADFTVDILNLNAMGAASDVALNSNVGANTTAMISAGNTITQGAFTLTAGSLSLSFVNGPVTLSTDIFSLSSNAAGQMLTINESDSISLFGQTLDTLAVNANGTITAAAPFTVATLELNASGALGDIALNADVTGTSAVNLNAGNTISQSALTTVGGGGLSLTWVNGDVSLVTAVSALTASSPGNDLTIDNTGDISIGAIDLASLNVTTASDITTSADCTVADLALNASTGSIHLNSNVNGTNSITLTAADTIDQLAGKTLGGGGALSVTFVNGPVELNTDVSSISSNAAGQSLSITNARTVTLAAQTLSALSVINGGDILTFAGVVVTGDLLLDAGTNTITLNTGLGGFDNGTFNAASVSLPNGGIIQGLTMVDINGSLTAGSGSAVTVNAGTTIEVSEVQTLGSDFTASSGGTLETGILVADNVNLTGNTSVVVNGGVSILDTWNITTPDFTYGGVGTIINAVNVNSLAGGSLTVRSPAGQPVAANFVCPQINFDADSGDLNLFGSINFVNGVATLTADAPGQAIIVNADADVVGTNQVTLNTCNLQLIGTLVGNPIVYNCPLNGGTIANSQGDVNLYSPIVFNGLNFAIIASGSINDFGAGQINLSNAAGDGGNLILIAGFNFIPATSGETDFPPGVPNNVMYTLGNPTTAGGSINLGSVSINTSSVGGDAGSVTAIAHAGNAASGEVALGTIDTTATGNGGDVFIIGHHEVRPGNIDTTGATSGNVFVASAEPIIIGGPIYIAGGEKLGAGTFGTNDLPFADIFMKNVTANQVVVRGSSFGLVYLDGAINANVVDVTASNDIFVSYAVTGTGVNPSISLVAGNSVATALNSGTLSAATITLESGNANFISATIDASAYANSVISITQGAKIEQPYINYLVSAETLNLTSTGGSIGDEARPIHLINPSTVNLSSASDAYLLTEGSITLGTIDVPGVLSVNTSLNPASGGSITVTTPINATQVQFNTGGAFGGFIDVNGTITANNIMMTAVNGTMFNGDITIDAAVTGTAVDPAVTLVAGNDFTSTGPGIISGHTIDIQANGGTLALAANVTASGAGNSISLTSDGSLSDGQVGQVTSESLSLTSASGDIGSNLDFVDTMASFLALNASGDVFVSNLGSVSLIGASAGASFNLVTSGADGGNIAIDGVVQADTVKITAASGLVANGDITLNDNVTGTTSVTFVADGNLVDNNVVTGATISLNVSGNIGAPGSELEITNGADTISLFVTTSGNWYINSLGTGTLTLNTSSGDDAVLVANGSVETNGDSTFTGDLSIVTNDFTVGLNNDITAGTITVTSHAGSDLTVSGNGPLASLIGNAFVPGAPGTPGPSAVSLIAMGDLSLNDNLTISGDATLSAVGDVIVEDGANYNGLNNISLNACDALVYGGAGTGVITANDLILTIGCGTIVNPTGDINLTGDIIFADGRDVAILAFGNINAGSATTIDLSNVAGNGGDLTLVAGWNMTGVPPLSPGQQITGSDVTLTTASTGSINLGGVTINLSHDFDSVADGGSLLAVANGNVTLGPIMTNTNDSTGASSAGSVTVIASGNIGLDSISLASAGGGTNGDLTVSAATPTIVNPFTVQDGSVTSGSFVSGAATTGNVTFNNDVTGADAVTVASLGMLTTAVGASVQGNSVALQGGEIGTGVATPFTTDTQLLAVPTTNNAFINNLNVGMLTLAGSDATNTLNIVTAGDLTSSASFNLPTMALTANDFNLSGNFSGTTLSLTSVDDLLNGDVTGVIAATNYNLRTTGAGSDIGNGTGARFNIGANVSNVTATSDQGGVFLQSTRGVLQNIGASTSAGAFDFLGAGPVTIGGNITTTNGDLNITTAAAGNLTVGAGVILTANGTGANGNMVLANLGTDAALTKIILQAGSQLLTNAAKAGVGSISLQVGAAFPPPTGGKGPKTVTQLSTPPGVINWGAKAKKRVQVAGTPVTVNAEGANVNFQTQFLAGIQLNANVNIHADPPVAQPLNASAAKAVVPQQGVNAVDNANPVLVADMSAQMVTPELALPTMDAVLNPTVQTISPATNYGATKLMTAEQRMKGSVEKCAASDDDSYITSYGAPLACEAAICSDSDLGIKSCVAESGESEAVERIELSDRVVLRKGNVLFVPFRDTVVETPKGIVKIAARSVAMVASTESSLAVYDIDDNHKGSVVVEAEGRTMTLSPGRHITIANHKGEFEHVNAIETVMHRGMRAQMVRDGVKAFSSEFSIPTAVDSIKPLKAMALSKHPHASKVADHMMKTAAVIMHLTNGAGNFQAYMKPRMTAINW